MSRHQSLQLPIIVSDPIWRSDRRGYIETIFDTSNDTQVISNTKGFDKFNFTLNTSIQNAEDWLINGIGRDIVRKNESLKTIWEGFVSKVDFNVGSTNRSTGPLLRTENKTAVIYSTLDTSTSPPTNGEREQTDFAEDLNSQELYGIIEKVYSQGGTISGIATQVRDKYLAARSRPPTSSDFNFGSSSSPSIKINCLGYYYWLDSYIYSKTGIGTISISDKIIDILANDPNGIFSTDYSGIEDNNLLVPIEDSGTNNRARKILDDIVTLGNSSQQRYNFMIGTDRKVTYQAVEDKIELIYRIRDGSQIIENIVGDRIKPWSILPGVWQRTTDVFVGRTIPNDIRKDLRNSFITQTSFSSPSQLRLKGDNVEDINQLMAQISGGVQVNG